jgi:hypothetical protein
MPTLTAQPIAILMYTDFGVFEKMFVYDNVEKQVTFG